MSNYLVVFIIQFWNSIFGSIMYGRVKISPDLNKHKLKSKHFKINVLDTF